MPVGRKLPAVTKNRNYPQPAKHLKPLALPTPDVNINVTPVDSDKVVKYYDSDIGVGGVMAYTGKVTSAESLGRILQQARLLSGLSQRELARRLGTTQKYVWELEAGKPSIMMDRLFAAMRETGMELTATITPQDEHG
jgi:DNA-binding XRE family transcriptional regulator